VEELINWLEAYKANITPYYPEKQIAKAKEELAQRERDLEAIKLLTEQVMRLRERIEYD
jgi:hypothetical protein